jgi:ABC-type branched-subunit amino acid transport system substrate-binding protein
MTSTRVFYQASSAFALTLGMLAGCNSIVGLDKIEVGQDPTETAGAGSGGRTNPNGGTAGASGGDFSEGGTGNIVEAQGGEAGSPEPPECTTNQECTDAFSNDAMGEGGAAAATIPGACIQKPHAHCVKLLSEDCEGITGDYTNNRAIFIGSLFQTKGSTAATNINRQQAASLGVEQINKPAGGIPINSTSANARPLVMVSCDAFTNLVRAATHLVTDLHVPAIVGPNTSQDTLDVSTKVTVAGGTVVMSPSGVASSIANLSDNDLTWLMVPSDVQRAPLMIDQINALEADVNGGDTSKTVKLGVVYRDDALGQGTRDALSSLTINKKPLNAAPNQNGAVQIDPYNGADANQDAIVTKYTTTFLPDIIVLAGTAEAITKVMVPIEAAWALKNPSLPPPQYVVIDSTKGPELLTAVTGNDSLRTRVRGTGITSGPPTSGSPADNTPADAFLKFQLAYSARYNGAAATTAGMGPAHDAAYAIGLALAATRTQEVSGASVALGLRKLAGGATVLEVNSSNVLPAMQKLGAGEKISAVGTFGMLDWDVNGAVKGGTLEIWCIGSAAGKPVYGSSTLTYDIMTKKRLGEYQPCPVTP